jgi:glycosyltransferase involved in cell wall biosynthesis
MIFKLPPALTKEELATKARVIAPVPPHVHRPFWSVVIPTYNRPHYLTKTLKSVLAQDPGSDHMEIIVSDNCSTVGNAQDIVRELAGKRVTFVRHQPALSGLDHHNFVLQRARGIWVHLLHDDDMVMPGFYEACQRITNAHPEVLMIQGKVVCIDEKDRWLSIQGPLPTGAGYVIEDYRLHAGVGNPGLISATVVKRDVYQEVGGFADIVHCPDWELYFRIAQCGPVAGTKRPYVYYRVHSQMDTVRNKITGSNILGAVRLHKRFIEELGIDAKKDARFNWRSNCALHADLTSWQLDTLGYTEGRLVQANLAFLLEPTWPRLRNFAKSWVKHKLRKMGLFGTKTP